MTTFVIKTTSSRGILHYFSDLVVKTYKFRWKSTINTGYKYTSTVHTVEVGSVGDILKFMSVDSKEVVLGWWFTNIDLVHPEDRETVEYLKTLPFIEIYDDYRE